MSALRFEATTTERSSGLSTNLADMASTSTLSVVDVGVVLRDAGEGLVPQHHAVLLGVALGDAGDLLHPARAGQVEGEADDPLAALLGEQRGLQGDLVARTAGRQVAAAEAGVLALAVLPDHDPVEVGVVGLAQRRDDAGVEVHRPDVGPLVEVLRDVQPQAPERDVVRDGRPADGAEVDGVVVLQGLQPVLGHHPAGPGVVLAAPVELVPGEGERAVRVLGQGVENPAAGGDDLFADAVGGDGCDLVGALRCGHRVTPGGSVR